jgi:hypothetical protein
MCNLARGLTYWPREQMVIRLNTARVRIPYCLHLQIFYRLLLIYIFHCLFNNAVSFSDYFTPYDRNIKE